MVIFEYLFNFIGEFWGIALWTGAWYVFPLWVIIELVIATAIIFILKISKEDFRDNWKKGYFKQLGAIGLRLITVRTFLTMFIFYILASSSLHIHSLFSLNFLMIIAFLLSAGTIWNLVKIILVQSVRAKVYLALLSVPIAFIYSVAISIALI